MFKKTIQKLRAIDSNWFFSPPPFWVRFLTIYAKGDALILVPLWLFVSFASVFNAKYSLIASILFLFLRSFIEMIYWIFQQFSDRQYRPQELNFPNLDNHAIYILYQLINLIYSTFWGTILIYLIKS